MVLTRRASSAALDTLLFVVLVGAAVAVFATATPADPTTTRVTEETGDVLATSTTTIEFRRSGTIGHGADERSVSVERQAHGTYAELLAAATIATPAWDGQELTDSGASLVAATRRATGRVLGMREANARVSAVWRPFPGAALTGRTAVGEQPPDRGAIAATTVTVPSGFENVTARALRAARAGGFGSVSRVVAQSIVDGLFPPGRTADALRSDGPDRVLVQHRYRSVASVVGADLTGPLERENVTAANRRLVRALTLLLTADLEGQYDSPVAAAKALELERVRIVVRTWEP